MTPEEKQKLNFVYNVLSQMVRSDRIVFDKSVQFKGNKIGFYGSQLLGIQGVSPMTIGTVSGTLDDATVNGNFTSIKSVWDELRLGLIDLGLFTG